MALTIFISALASGCQSLPPYPDHLIYDVDLDHKVCGEWKVDEVTRRLVKIRDLPLGACDGNLSVKYKDALKIKAWVVKVEKKWNEVCK